MRKTPGNRLRATEYELPGPAAFLDRLTPGPGHRLAPKEAVLPHGTWTTTGSGDGSKAVAGVAVAAVIAALAYEAAKGAARMLGEILVIGGTAAVALAAGIGVTLLAVRLQGRRRARDAVRPAVPVQLWRANQSAVPVQSRRAIEAPAAPVVNVNIDAGLLAALIEAARRQPVPVIVPSDAEELPR